MSSEVSQIVWFIDPWQVSAIDLYESKLYVGSNRCRYLVLVIQLRMEIFYKNKAKDNLQDAAYLCALGHTLTSFSLKIRTTYVGGR